MFNIGSQYNLNSKVGNKPVLINNAPIPRTGTITCLGVDLDEKLSCGKDIESVCSKVSAGIGVMRRIYKTICSSKNITRHL